MSLSVRKLTNRIGGVVDGIGLTADPDVETVEALRHALNLHKAIVFDHVALDDTSQERVARWIEKLTTAHPTVPAADDTTNVLSVDSETSKANQSHSDVAFVVNRPQVSTLPSIVTTPHGGQTLIATTAAASHDLLAPLRALADSLWAVNTNTYGYLRPTASTATQQEHERIFVSTEYEAEHPVVRVHPLTEERGLFIGGFVNQLLGLSGIKSAELLRIFQSSVRRPQKIVRWSCSPSQLLIFDNRATQHHAIDSYDYLPRRLNPVTVAGDVPTAVNEERSRQMVGDASHCSRVLEIAA